VEDDVEIADGHAQHGRTLFARTFFHESEGDRHAVAVVKGGHRAFEGRARDGTFLCFDEGFFGVGVVDGVGVLDVSLQALFHTSTTLSAAGMVDDQVYRDLSKPGEDPCSRPTEGFEAFDGAGEGLTEDVFCLGGVADPGKDHRSVEGTGHAPKDVFEGPTVTALRGFDEASLLRYGVVGRGHGPKWAQTIGPFHRVGKHVTGPWSQGVERKSDHRGKKRPLPRGAYGP